MTRIVGLDAPGREKAPDLLIETPYPNTQGIYVRGQNHDGYPAYCRSCGKPFIYKYHGKHWVIGDELGGSSAYHIVQNSAADDPENADWEDVTCREAAEPDTSKAVRLVRVKSSYKDLDGGYKRIDDFDAYPCYLNAEDGKYLFHSRVDGAWYISDKMGAAPYYATGKATSVHCDTVRTWNPPLTVEAITWEGVEDQGFVDLHFPAVQSSIGPGGKEGMWIRATDLVRGTGPPAKLFDEVHPNDCLQGGGGGCWLLAAMASVAEFPDCIERCFPDGNTVSSDGRYRILLYDMRAKDFRPIMVDDLLPCEPRAWWEQQARTLFARPQGQELWVLLLEKAFAKFVGSYEELRGGQPSWAWQLLTGVEAQTMYTRTGSDWRKSVVDPDKQRALMEADRRACPFYATPEAVDQDELFGVLQEFDLANFVMAATIETQGLSARKERTDRIREDGLVEGHAYSVLRCAECRGTRLLQLRNPWGTKEWTGAWSDRSSSWVDNPEVARAVDHQIADDGSFWMCLEHFAAHFTHVFVAPSTMPTKRGGQRCAKRRPRTGPTCDVDLTCTPGRSLPAACGKDAVCAVS